MNTLLTYLNNSKELIAYIAGSAAIGSIALYLLIPSFDTVLSQDIPQNLICEKNWLEVYHCAAKEDLLFAHRYQITITENN